MNIFNAIIDFINNNLLFIGQGYTALKTVTFSLILGLIVILLIYFFKKIKKNPIDLFLPILPFIFLGSSIRALVDNGIYPLTRLLITPGIYLLIGTITILILLFSIYLEKKIKKKYTTILTITGLILCIPNILNFPKINLIPLTLILIVWILFTTIFLLLKKKYKLLQDKYNLTILSAHLFDASTTFIAIDVYNYYEQHILPNYLIELTKTGFTIFPIKIITILTVLQIINTEIDDPYTKNMLKLAIFILGLAPGLRNLLTLTMAV